MLGREEHRAVHGLTIERTEAFLIGLAGIIEPVSVFFHWRPQMQDADDEMVLETALNGRAASIVTHNVRDFVPAASRFGLRVVRPGELVNEVLR